MTPKRIFLKLAMILTAQPASAAPGGVLCDVQASVSLRSPKRCSADEQSCESWRRFRDRHRFPFQSLNVEMLKSDEAIVIVSEPPPVASSEELEAFSNAVFGTGGKSGVRLRTPIGQDGWVDDLVFHVTGLSGPLVGFPLGDGGELRIPSSLADRLRYLSRHLFGDEEMTYVDRIGKEPLALPLVDNVRFNAADLRRALADHRSWSEATQEGESKGTFEGVQNSASPATWIDSVDELVAFVVPKQTAVERTRAAFRRFAVLSDQLVGAIGPSSGGMILLGRSRRVPLSSLPPLRFETLEKLSSSMGAALAQSYERNRSYAGKITSGPFIGWDWAPAYLSPQLEDTEFGMLLNLADQQLKSWTEHGEIRYAAFQYPEPRSYPFGDVALSKHLERTRHASVPSIIFNWNTNGYGNEVGSDKGDLISPSNTTALPVSYIVSSSGKADSAALELDADASRIGSDYFARIGDQIVARVARNVFLYQVLSATQPFSQKRSGSSLSTKRSAAVSAVLVQETTRWLTKKTKGEERSEQILGLLRKAALAPEPFAQLMASPETSTQDIVRLANTASMVQSSLEEVAQKLSTVTLDMVANAPAAEASFRSRCVTPPIRTKDGLTCQASPYVPRGAAEHKQDRLREDQSRLEKEGSKYKQQLIEIRKGLTKLALQREAASNAVELQSTDERRRRAVVFESVLKAGQSAPSSGFIQTPSIALSCSSESFFVVGGHNIDPLPRRPLQDGSATLIGQLGRKLPLTDQAPPPSTREPAVALNIQGKPPHGSFLDLIRNRTKLREESASVAEVARERAELCNCDIYVERGAGGIVTLVETRPPPNVMQILGSTKLVDKLAESKGSKRVVFAGYEPHTVAGLARAASSRAKNASRLPVGAARRMFETPEATASTTLRTTTTAGKLLTMGASSLSALTTSLAKHSTWRDVSITPGAPGVRHLVEVNFGEHAGDLHSLKVYAYDASGTPVVSARLSAIATSEFRAANNASVKQAVERVAARLTQNASVDEVACFFKNVGKIVRLRRSSPETNTLRLARGE